MYNKLRSTKRGFVSVKEKSNVFFITFFGYTKVSDGPIV